ncbi:MAG TPA: ABC transporter permease [Terriglobales bacterium]|nr:ABC transporter permease [Terriglobales bacterium]
MEGFLHDLRHAFRVLRKNPSFSTIAMLTLAIGIGATTSIFSVVYGVLLRPLPYENPDRIVELREVNEQGGRMQFADPNFEDIRTQSRCLRGLAEYRAMTVSIGGGSQPTRTMVAAVSTDFFSIMRVEPVLGRNFSPDDQHFGAAPTALVSYGYWQQFLGRASDFSTVKLNIDNQPARVLGVLPPGFRFPFDSQIWVPRELYERLPSRSAHNWHVIGRLQDEVSITQASSELAIIAHRLRQQYGQDTMMTNVSILPLREALTGNVRLPLMMLLGAVTFLLLIACANVAHMLLAQSAAREKEFAIRTALGAGRGRIIRQFLAESLLLAFSGGALGVLAGSWGVHALIAVAPHSLPRLEDLSVNLPVLLAAIGLVLLVAVGLGLFSAVRATSHDAQHVEGLGTRSTGSAHAQRIGRIIIAGQLAIALVLLVGAGLLGRSLLRVLSVDPGFRTEHVLTMNVALPFAGRDEDKLHRVQFLDRLLARLRRIPGVEEVGGTGRLPLTGTLSDGTYILLNPGESVPADMKVLEQMFHDPSRTGDAEYAPADAGYFRALEIPLLRGRLFDKRDAMNSPHVALISQSLSSEKWPHQDPLGRLIEFGNMDGDLRPLTVIGVVGDVHTESLERPAPPTIYVDIAQRPQSTYDFAVVIRAAADPPAVVSMARQILRELDPNVPPQFGTFDQVVASSLSPRRFNLLLVAVFAATALLLASAGLYGVIAYSVSRRTSEIGLRMALGATPASVLRLVLRQGMVVAAVGLVLGIFASIAVTRTLQSMLFALTATDPTTFAAVVGLLLLVALLACYLPARRAAKVDPVVALRYE